MLTYHQDTCHCARRNRKPGCPGLDVPYLRTFDRLSLPFRVLPAEHDTCGGINLGRADPASLTSRMEEPQVRLSCAASLESFTHLQCG